jgi:hypothetical protein
MSYTRGPWISCSWDGGHKRERGREREPRWGLVERAWKTRTWGLKTLTLKVR